MSYYASTPPPLAWCMGWAIESIFSIQHYTILSINSVLTVKTVCLYMVGKFRNLASGAYLVSQSGGGGVGWRKSSTFPIFSQISIFFSYFSPKFQNLLIFSSFWLPGWVWLAHLGKPWLRHCRAHYTSYQYYVDCIQRKIIQFSLKLLVKNY